MVAGAQGPRLPSQRRNDGRPRLGSRRSNHVGGAAGVRRRRRRLLFAGSTHAHAAVDVVHSAIRRAGDH